MVKSPLGCFIGRINAPVIEEHRLVGIISGAKLAHALVADDGE
jgi:hypothetical protein